jgi:HPt (histidine-containing phosphotransfer) domain-containing protein
MKGIGGAEYFAIKAVFSRERCLQLGAAIDARRASQDVMDTRNTEIDGAARPVLDGSCLAELRGLDPDGKAQLVPRVLAAFQTSLVRLVEQLRQARAEGAWEEISRVAHTLKSSSASIGALDLAAVCAEIENLLREGDHDGAVGLLDRFGTEAGRVEIAVREQLAASGAPRP